MSLQTLRRRLKRFFPRKLRVHIEPFYKASLSTDTPGLTGWASRPVEIRACAESAYSEAQEIKRPDVPFAFYVPLPDLAPGAEVQLQAKKGNNWYIVLNFVPAKDSPRAPEQPTGYQSTLHKAVLIHAYYPEILREYEAQFSSFAQPVDFFLYIPEGSPMYQQHSEGAANTGFYKAVITGESRGRDAMGFLKLTQYLLANRLSYDAILVLQTKKSPQFPPSEGKAWRDMLVYPLMGSAEQIDTALGTLFSDDAACMAGAQDFLQVYRPEKGVGNYSRFVNLCDLFGLPVQKTDFIAGTMFWLKFAPLKNLFTAEKLQTVIDWLESGANEPSYAHAWERFIGLVATHDGKSIKQLEYPSAYRIR